MVWNVSILLKNLLNYQQYISSYNEKHEENIKITTISRKHQENIKNNYSSPSTKPSTNSSQNL